MDGDRENVSDVEKQTELSCKEETDEEISLQQGVQPYQFEPCRQQSDCGSQSNSTPESADADESCRIGNIDWCACGFCQAMETQTESVCCKESPKIWRKVLEHRYCSYSKADSQEAQCITEVAGFEPVCLNPFVLETAYLHFKQEYDDSLDTHTQAGKYRYTAYRQLVRWCYGFLGRNIRVPLPSCAVNRIRTEFPEDGQGYTGFRWPLL